MLLTVHSPRRNQAPPNDRFIVAPNLKSFNNHSGEPKTYSLQSKTTNFFREKRT